MKSHADALAELAKDFPEVGSLITDLANGFPTYRAYELRRMVTLAATLNAQRKQLESRVEKLERATQGLYDKAVAIVVARDGRHNAEFVAEAVNVLRDALAKEQPRE